MINGRIHSIESAGLVDGPGIRTVVFFQGCMLRCSYCHNPDTWIENQGNEISAETLLKKILRFKPYFDKSGGGVTFSGGDPLLQPDFLIEILKLCKDNGIHTAIDTSGFGKGRYEEILKNTDLVILDIKHIDDPGYIAITGMGKQGFDDFLEALQMAETPLWIRHVVVPNITDSKDHIIKLASIIRNIKNVKKIELLPYHLLGKSKYEKMGIEYKLEGVVQMDKTITKELQQLLVNSLSHSI